MRALRSNACGESEHSAGTAGTLLRRTTRRSATLAPQTYLLEAETSDRRDVFGCSEVRLGLIASDGLTDRSRRPYRHANQLPVQIEMLIVRCQQDKPHWGAPKIGERLARLYPDVHTPGTRCRRSSAAQARARRPRQPAEAATPSNYFLCRDPGAGFAPSCLGECAIAARHEPEHRTMWYRKNVGGWERAARLIGGGLMLICGLVALHASPLGLLLSGAGVVTLVTGVFGYCPACAIAGREPLKG